MFDSFFLILETYFRKFSICQKLLEHGTFNRFLIFFSKRDTERDIDTVYLVANTTESLNLFENRSKITPNNRTIPINILARYQKLPQIWQKFNFRFQLSNLSRLIGDGQGWNICFWLPLWSIGDRTYSCHQNYSIQME